MSQVHHGSALIYGAITWMAAKIANVRWNCAEKRQEAFKDERLAGLWQNSIAAKLGLVGVVENSNIMATFTIARQHRGNQDAGCCHARCAEAPSS